MKTVEKVITNDLREILKSIFKNKLQEIPTLFKELDKKDDCFALNMKIILTEIDTIIV